MVKRRLRAYFPKSDGNHRRGGHRIPNILMDVLKHREFIIVHSAAGRDTSPSEEYKHCPGRRTRLPAGWKVGGSTVRPAAGRGGRGGGRGTGPPPGAGMGWEGSSLSHCRPPPAAAGLRRLRSQAPAPGPPPKVGFAQLALYRQPVRSKDNVCNRQSVGTLRGNVPGMTSLAHFLQSRAGVGAAVRAHAAGPGGPRRLPGPPCLLSADATAAGAAPVALVPPFPNLG